MYFFFQRKHENERNINVMQYLHGVRKNRRCKIEILPWEYSSKGYRVPSMRKYRRRANEELRGKEVDFEVTDISTIYIYKVSDRDLRWT